MDIIFIKTQISTFKMDLIQTIAFNTLGKDQQNMHKLIPTIFLCYVCFVAFTFIQSGEATDELIRYRRSLVFLNSTRAYLKFNFKSNVIPWNQLFAQAIGFRMNWDVPPMTHIPFSKLHRREVYDYTETLLNKNGLSGYHCVRRAICEMQMIAEPNKMYHKLLKMVFGKQSAATERWYNATVQECDESISSCPFSLLEVSPYTDLG